DREAQGFAQHPGLYVLGLADVDGAAARGTHRETARDALVTVRAGAGRAVRRAADREVALAGPAGDGEVPGLVDRNRDALKQLLGSDVYERYTARDFASRPAAAVRDGERLAVIEDVAVVRRDAMGRELAQHLHVVRVTDHDVTVIVSLLARQGL